MAIDSFGSIAGGEDPAFQSLQLALQQGQAVAVQATQPSQEAKQVNASGSTRDRPSGGSRNPDLGQNLDIKV
jgi:hypothetical protein